MTFYFTFMTWSKISKASKPLNKDTRVILGIVWAKLTAKQIKSIHKILP